MSCFKAATLRANFGPNFKYPPPKVSPFTNTRIQALSERAKEIHVEQAISDMIYLVAEEEDILKKTKDFFENS